MKSWMLILPSLPLLQCARSTPDSPDPDSMGPLPVEIDASPFVRVGNAVPLTMVLAPDGAVPSCVWSASNGRISGEGPAVTFTAPDHPDTVSISVEARTENGTLLMGTTAIVVYRQWVVLKADDFRYVPGFTVSRGWSRFIDFVEEREIRASLGLIGIEIERGDSNFATMIRDIARNPRFEFWNHGYDHALNVPGQNGDTVSEFQGTSYEQQYEHILRTQALARERCGVLLRAFGAPGNAFDANTARAIEVCDDICIWFFGATYSSKLVLPYTVSIEQPIFQPNLGGFTSDYDPEPQFATYQIHPKDWDEARLGEFARIIDFLLGQEVTFVTPSELEAILIRTGIPRMGDLSWESSGQP